MKKKLLFLLPLLLILVTGCDKEMKCPGGFVLEGTKCVHEVERFEAEITYSCDEGAELTENNTCVRTVVKEATTSESCQEGLTLENGYCVGTLKESPVDAYKCNSGEELKGTKCIKSTVDNNALTATPGCPIDYDYIDGKCLANPRNPMGNNPGDCDWENNDYTNCHCESGDYYRTSDHYCYSEAKVGWMYECAEGTVLKNNKCYKQTETAATPYKKCNSGYTLSGNECVKNVKEKLGKTLVCEQDFTLNGQFCEKVEEVPAIPNYNCPDGYEVIDSSCVKRDIIEAE